MHCPSGVGDPINSFALVFYIPDPMGSLLDRLRRELVPSCFAHAHVTVLPPRPIANSAQALSQLRGAVHEFRPFLLDLGGIEVFSETSVIHLGIGRGRTELRRMHDALNRSALFFQEPYLYHPHVTLAQDLTPDQVPPLLERANQVLAGYQGPRSFEIEALTFVQNTNVNHWRDLEEFSLGDPVMSGV
jgi:2'-5' RNA ligase